jgi:hypothetical protein
MDGLFYYNESMRLERKMKKILLLLLLMSTTVFAITTPGVFHVVFDNGIVTSSGDDTFFEFDILAYVTDTENANDLLVGSADIYVEYDTELFGSAISGTPNLEVTQIDLLTQEALPGYNCYNIYDSQNTYPNVFSITFDANFTSSPGFYNPISTDPANPSGLFHVKMKAFAAGSGEVLFPYSSINDADKQFWTLANLQYYGPNDFTDAVEPVYIEGPVTGEPYTSIELDYFSADNKGGKVRLRWRTQSETENLGFIIKRAVVLGENIYGVFEVIDSYIENDDLIGAGTTSKKTDYMYWDNEVKPGVTYAYVLQDVDEGGHIRECDPVFVQIKESKVISTDKFEFSASYPNPFNPAFIIPFELYNTTSVNIKLYDISGHVVKEIANRDFATGTYKLLVNGNDLSSGMYLLRIIANDIVSTQKMLLVK